MTLRHPVGHAARGAALATVAVATLTGCSLNRTQSALDPAGPQAARLEGLWWLSFWIATAAWALTVLAMLWATLHRRRPAAATVVATPPARERRMLVAVAAATGLTVLVLFGFLVADLLAARAISTLQQQPAMHVKVTGYQWWWKVEYVDTSVARTVVTANEIHIPVGRPVRLELVSGDVIHSFWVPALHGKRDLVPGLKNQLWLQADRAGVYRGECAEFCGHQHAKMGLVVVAEPQAEFAAWYERQLQEAEPPTDTLRKQGLATFETKACAMCHQIRGTGAAGQVGPDLTHLASRRTIAAASLPNTRGHLGGWIIDPQRLKPGTRMPPNNLTPVELRSLLAYLEGLQ